MQLHRPPLVAALQVTRTVRAITLNEEPLVIWSRYSYITRITRHICRGHGNRQPLTADPNVRHPEFGVYALRPSWSLLSNLDANAGDAGDANRRAGLLVSKTISKTAKLEGHTALVTIIYLPPVAHNKAPEMADAMLSPSSVSTNTKSTRLSRKHRENGTSHI